MSKIIKKIIFLSIALIIFLSVCVFAENIDLNFSYGINNIAKKGEQLPIELRISNRDNSAFKGYVNVNVYESNRSVFVYKIDLEIHERETVVKNENISINNGANTIILEIYNHRDELVTTDRTVIDLSYYDDRMIIGVLSSDYNSLSYLDDLTFNNNTLKTVLVEINEENYERNNNILEQLDMLLISDINLTKLNESLNFAIDNYIKNGNFVVIGLGGKNGIFTLPNALYGELSGPTFESKGKLNNVYNIAITNFEFINGKRLDGFGDDIIIENLSYDNDLVLCSCFSFNDISEYRDNVKTFASMIEKSFGDAKLSKLVNVSNQYLNNDYYNISNLLNIVDKLKLPDIFVLTIILVIYISILTIIIYVYLRNIDKRERYGLVAAIFSIIFTFAMLYLGYGVMKKNTFLTYISVVDIKDVSTRERAFLNFRTSEQGSYAFDTSTNNKLYPMIKSNRDPILSVNFLNPKAIKYTSFYKSAGRINVNVANAEDFDSNIFVYENNNYLNDIYNIDCEIDRFDGEITGRITNRMDIKINDANILLFGKVLKIGDIDANRSVSLTRAENIGAPIGNNFMLSEILSNSNNQNILKYYLDENVYSYFDYAILFGFIDNNGTIDINSTDVGDVYGRTLIARRIPISKRVGLKDVCSLKNEVNNINGYYDYDNNSIDGRSEVINEYTFDDNNLVSQIYFEDLDSYDSGNLDYNVPFYGDISIYNLETENFDALYNNKISFSDLNKYLDKDNKITVKFVPSSIDPLYRKISLPVLRAIAS